MSSLSRGRGWLFLICMAALMCLLCSFSNEEGSIFWDVSESYTDTSLTQDLSQLSSIALDTRSNYTLQANSPDAFSRENKEAIYDFEVSEVYGHIGEKFRSVLGVNHQYPGPLIEANEGDTVVVRVKNASPSSGISLHFHGQAMNRTNYYDGATGVTQCAIKKGKTFEYRFVAGPSGTYWYHAHTGLQAAKGLVGPLIVHGNTTDQLPDILQDIEKDHAIMLTDLYARNPDDLMAIYQEPWLGGHFEPPPSVALSQGKRYPIVEIPKSSWVRLRLVNAASFTLFKVQMNTGQVFKVVEADGTLTEPTATTSLLIYPAQRYSILVNLDESAWLFTTPQLGLYDSGPKTFKQLKKSSSALRTLLYIKPAPTENEGIQASYVKSGSSYPVVLPGFSSMSTQEEEDDFVDAYFEPYGDETPPENPDLTVRVDLTMERDEEGVRSGAITGSIYRMKHHQLPLAGLMKSQLEPRGASLADRHVSDVKEFAERSDAAVGLKELMPEALVVTNNITIVDLVIRNYDDGLHPIHMHGHQFWIMERGTLADDSNATRWNRPLKRDTLSVPKGEYAVLRVILDNPGIWLLHCHIPWHSLTGMRTFIVSQPARLKEQKAPESWYKLCD